MTKIATRIIAASHWRLKISFHLRKYKSENPIPAITGMAVNNPFVMIMHARKKLPKIRFLKSLFFKYKEKKYSDMIVSPVR